MYSFTEKSVVLFNSVKRSVGLLTGSPLLRRQIFTFRHLTSNTKTTKTVSESKDLPELEEDCSHIMWWKKQMEMCRKASTMKIIKKLSYSNLLGLDENDDNLNESGLSLKEGTYAWETLKFTSKSPRDVLLRSVEEIYEGIGFDACILMEYADALQLEDDIPQAYVFDKDLHKALDDLTNNGFSVVIMGELKNESGIQPVNVPLPSYESHEKQFELFWKDLAKSIWTEGGDYDELIELCIPGIESFKFFIAPPCKQEHEPIIDQFSYVYLMFKPDQTVYIGQTDDVNSHVREEKSKMGENALCMYVMVPDKSVASQLIPVITKKLPICGFGAANGSC